MANKLKVNDEVIVLSGKDKGKRGKITKMITDRKKVITHAYVTGIGLVKKTKRPNPNKAEQGGIVTQEAAIAISNLAIYNSSTAKADRVGFKRHAQGKKQRIFRSSSKWIDF